MMHTAFGLPEISVGMIDDLLACLYGLYALLCLHFVQEEENFFVLAPTLSDQ